MKKLLGILILSLLWCNVGFASDTTLKVGLYILDINEKKYKNKLEIKDIEKDLKIANELWKKASINFKPIVIKKIKATDTNYHNNVKFLANVKKNAKEKYDTQSSYTHKDFNYYIKRDNILIEFLGLRDIKKFPRDVIHAIYLPKLVTEAGWAGLGFTDKELWELYDQGSGTDYYRQNFVFIGVKDVKDCRAKFLAHEIGHIIVGEKNGRETHFGGRKDLMSRGGCGTNITKQIIDLSSQNFMNYSKFVFKK